MLFEFRDPRTSLNLASVKELIALVCCYGSGAVQWMAKDIVMIRVNPVM